MRTLRVAFLSSFALELLSSLATALVALVLGLRLLNGSLGLNVALAILLLTPEAFLPLRRSAAQFHASSDGIAAATELLGLLEQPTRSGSSPAPVAPPALELRGVRTGAGPVPDLHLRAGSTLILEGPSGSGKTTLLQVLAGVRPLTSGVVVVDGTDLATMAVDEWHRVVGYVVQDAALPGETVADVLTGGDDTFDDAQLTGALRDVGLDLALDRVVGEGGGGLSAGQRRRLALARSILRRPLVLLLDEPLAHLDPDTASAIAAVIEALPMTRVIATHRPMVGDVHLTLATEVLRG